MRLTSPIFLAIVALVEIISRNEVHALEHFCTTVQELRDAMIAVLPGDEIVLAKGTIFTATDTVPGDKIGAHFSSDVDGTEDQRIIIRSESPDDPATLSGDNVAKRHVMRLFGDYWVIRDIKFTYAQKGIVLDNANYVQILGCEVHYIGYEAIHVRDGSQNCLIEDCFVHDTGVSNPSFGEGIYVGSANKHWRDFDPHVNGTIIRKCIIGPYVRAEPFDIKEGTAETYIEHNIVDALGISGANYADSFVDLKGTRTYVRYNTFYKNGAVKLAKAIAIVWRPVPRGDMSTYEHTIHDNIFHLDDSGIDMVHAYSGFRDIYAFNNLPLDGKIADGVYQACCPPWYSPPRNETLVCVPPKGYFSSAITNTSATLAWTGYAASFTIRYNKVGSSLVQDVSTLNSTYLLDDLDYNVTYEWKVKSNCANSTSNFTGLDYFTTGKSDGGPPPYSEGAEIIYDENLRSFWKDYSFGSALDLADTSNARYGSHAIKCSYGKYGGLNLKRTPPVDASNFTHFRFWANGNSTTNGAGKVRLRLRIDNVRFDIDVMNGAWQNYQFSLDYFNNPDSIENIIIQSDMDSERVILFDQIELISDKETVSPSQSPISQL